MAKPVKGSIGQQLLDRSRSEILNLDIGCGDNKLENHIGVDIVPQKGVDVVADLTKPWPFADETFTLLSASHVLEHIKREDMTFLKFMDEAWRVLKNDGQFRIAVPMGGSTMYFADPTHVNPIVPQTFHYFDPMAPLQTYHVYKPKPWKIEQLYWQPDGILECLLIKRREDESYGKR